MYSVCADSILGFEKRIDKQFVMWPALRLPLLVLLMLFKMATFYNNGTLYTDEAGLAGKPSQRSPHWRHMVRRRCNSCFHVHCDPMTLGILIALLLIGLPLCAGATTYYVTTTGSNSADGSSSRPWLTIQHAADTMVAGDTVMVGAGTYNERIITTRAGTDSSHYITFKTTASAQILGFNILHDYIRVEGFNITNAVGSACTDSCVDSSATYAGVYIGADYAQVVGNYIYNIGFHGAIQSYPRTSPASAYVANNHG